MRKFLKKLLFLHGGRFFFLAALSVAMLLYCFTDPGVPEAAEYAAYILSAYTLTVLCCRLPALFRFLQNLGQKNKYMARYRSDTRWRITLSLYGSFAVNCAYALLQFGLGVYHATVWYYSMAAYTFTAFTLSVINLIRYRKYQSPVFSAAKVIGLVAAMVSMLTLETTMLTVFGKGENGSFNRIMTGATGAAVTLTVLVMAVYMIIKSAGELNRQNNNTLT